MWCGEWCWWRGEVPYPSTNNQLNPSVTAILGQCLSLSTGTSVSQFVSHPSQRTDMPLIVLQWLRTAISLLHARRYSQRCYRGCDGVWVRCLLSVTSIGKLGIEMPHRNLLVMERTYIALSLSVQGWWQHVGDIWVSTEYRLTALL